MNRTRKLTKAQVLARIKRGDFPTFFGWGGAAFQDGTKTDQRTVAKLIREGKVESLGKMSSIWNPYILSQSESGMSDSAYAEYKQGINEKLQERIKNHREGRS